jgi:GT2 family glycosyltransferase
MELSAPLVSIPPTDSNGTRYGGARVIVRLHTRPLGVVDVALGEEGAFAASCAAAIWAALGAKVNDHLRRDGLPEVLGLDERGLAPARSPRCLLRRLAVLATAPPASVIVCTRNRAELLARTLSSLEQLDYPDYELIVVDGSRTSATADLVRERFPAVRFLDVGDHGKCVALNRGVAAASGTIAAFTDDDVQVDRHWLAQLVAAFDDDRVACVTGAVLPLELRTRAQLWFEESGGFTNGFEPRKLGLDLPREPGSLVPYATGRIGAGVNMAWRPTVLRDLGGFDVALDTLRPVWPPGAGHRTAAEDLAAFFDALVRGYRIVFEPGAIVFHEHRRTYDELAEQLYWHGIGLSAYLTRCLVTRPAQIPDFLRRVPSGIAYGFAALSQGNDDKSANFPPALTRAEWRGVIHGPFAYLKGLPLARRIRAAQVGDRAR